VSSGGLSVGALHAWAAPVAEVEALGVARHLDDQERARAERFLVPEPRRRYVAARGLLRRLAGRQLGVAPERVEIVAGPNGKPLLAGDSLHVSVSHSGDWVLVALAVDRPLGADVEQIRASPDLMDVARRYFAREEALGLAGLSESERPGAFFSLWTRKEACLKVHGEGIGGGLGRPLGAFAPVVARGLDLAPGYCAALAAPGDDWQARRHPELPR
jgi:4'-phosphopantetheinyl transferase